MIRESNLPVQFGGGIRSAGQVAQLAEAGVSRIVLGTIAVENPDMLAELVERFGERIVVGIDARNGQVATRGWVSETHILAIDLAKQIKSVGVRRVVYTDISRDGMLTGPNIEMTHTLAAESGLTVTASGGVSSLEDLVRLRSLTPVGVDSVIIGKALYEGRFTLREALAVARGENLPPSLTTCE